jgi:hypothetical protein
VYEGNCREGLWFGEKNWSVMPFVPLAFEFEMAGLLPCWLGWLELAGSSPAAGSKLRNRLVASTFPSSGKKISHFCSFLFALLHSTDLTYNLIYHVIFTFLQSCFRFNRKKSTDATVFGEKISVQIERVGVQEVLVVLITTPYVPNCTPS